MADEEAADRLQAELELLEAMYPEAVSFSPKAREVRYVHTSPNGTLVLRLSDLYPEEGLPEAITATGPRREDLRSAAKEAISGLQLAPGEEVLDAIIFAFQELLASYVSSDSMKEEQAYDTGSTAEGEQCRTVVIWLHHLLNTNKRKLALNPTVSNATQPISGLTKPGYPGILVYSGPKSCRCARE